MKRFALALVALAVIAVPFVVFAQDAGGAAAGITAPDPGADVPGFAKLLWTTVQDKDWGKLIFLSVTAMVWALRKYLGPKVPFLNTEAGLVVLHFAVSFSGVLATSWPAGTKINAHALLMALYGGFIAAGGWHIIENLWSHFKKVGSGAPAAAKA